MGFLIVGLSVSPSPCLGIDASGGGGSLVEVFVRALVALGLVPSAGVSSVNVVGSSLTTPALDFGRAAAAAFLTRGFLVKVSRGSSASSLTLAIGSTCFRDLVLVAGGSATGTEGFCLVWRAGGLVVDLPA
jgi:hypothetical protein